MAITGLTPAGFQRLLSALDKDPDRAAEAYERLRYRTIGLLQWWGAFEAEDLADETLDRVARKLQEGASIGEGSLGAYVRGVARMIFYESRRRPQAFDGDASLLSPRPSIDAATGRCLDSCLGQLAADERDLLLRYYGDGKAADVRRTLAAELDLSLEALRVRAHRARIQVERCVKGCVLRS